jgi:hypothetical protein
MVLRAAGLLLRRLPGLLQHILNLVVTVGSKNAVQTAFVCTNVVLLSISRRPRCQLTIPLITSSRHASAAAALSLMCELG